VLNLCSDMRCATYTEITRNSYVYTGDLPESHYQATFPFTNQWETMRSASAFSVFRGFHEECRPSGGFPYP